MVQDVLKLNRRDRAHRETFQLGDYLRTFVAQFCQIEKVPGGGDRASDRARSQAITFDRSHLNQVMWNLCRNALRYCQRKAGSIRICSCVLGARANTVELDVIDDGPGVPEAMRPHLFEPFFTTAASGTGLGLYIAREICDANNATLEYVERPVGGRSVRDRNQGSQELKRSERSRFRRPRIGAAALRAGGRRRGRHPRADRADACCAWAWTSSGPPASRTPSPSWPVTRHYDCA